METNKRIKNNNNSSYNITVNNSNLNYTGIKELSLLREQVNANKIYL